MRWEESGAVCSYSDYIDELEDEITEKDKLLEEQFLLVSQISMEKNTLKIQLQEAKDLVRELHKFRCGIIGLNTLEKIIKKNADKIKSLLGEE